MANKGLALIFGDKKGGGAPMAEDDERDDTEGTGDEELRDVARKMLDACKNDDEDLMTEALDDLRALDMKQDEGE